MPFPPLSPHRDFVRLGQPLCCATEDEDSYDAKLAASNATSSVTFAVDKTLPSLMERTKPQDKKPATNGGPVPLTRVKCLVSMTTPRDVRWVDTLVNDFALVITFINNYNV